MKKNLFIIAIVNILCITVFANKEIYITVVNNRSVPLSVGVEIFKNNMATNASYYFCWGPACYPPSVTSGPPETIDVGTSNTSFHGTYILGDDSLETSDIMCSFYANGDYADSLNVSLVHGNMLAVNTYLQVEFYTSGDVNMNGSIDAGEIAGDENGDGSIGNGEIAGDINGDGSIGTGEITGDVNGDGTISGNEVSGDANGNGVIDGSEVLGIASMINLLKHSLYPNPASSSFTVEYDLKSNLSARLIVVDVLGNAVQERNLEFGTHKLTVNTSNISTGVYFYSLLVAGEIIATKKLVISR